MPKPCVPDPLPLQQLEWRTLLPLVGHANACLARYDGMVQTLPNAAVLLSPITTQEAVLSSKIEGTQATLDEVLEAEAGLIPAEARRDDIDEINNYRAAVYQAEHDLGHRGITLSLIKAAHQRLLQGVRGRDKTPGKFRDDQNWIGRRGDPIEKARFVPPNPMIMQAALDDWASYIELQTEDPILQTAIAHAQFEIIHPFRDGNGRIGRMLIPLILYKRKTLFRPMFYMSEYLEEHREEYYDRLLAITSRGDWQGWISFFLEAMIVQAIANTDKVRRIRDLYEETKKTVVDITHSQFAIGAVDALFAQPVISSVRFGQSGGFANRVTANNMLRQLDIHGVIRRIRAGSGRTPATYAFPALINIAEGKTVFRA
ncbi:MAG: Fic family protein [Qipengyuania sp.]|jgi:Fic family protein|nr:Fic family protein [Qipengyuania sp.]